ncbi:AI-2E family transporter [Metaclostridioides mangenotii]|uniref:PurR-regulated permease PerM n=1 Tax=Metaclostridioides mangenotii TaxID=1540 RepID=A0ABS4E8T2_9FIRM|nr:AI-2E family transporter [Clostridioides mangenotii]MBP1854331.1 putative PurR-regulated permease PerM [Clostridioides mangenotii]
MKKLKMNWNLWTEGLLFVITVIFIYKVVANLQPIIENIRSFLGVISPFIIGIIIAYFLNVPCNLVEKQISKVKYQFIVKRARIISVLAIYLGAILIIMLIISYVFPIIIKNILEIARDIPFYHYDIIQWVGNLDVSSFIGFFDLKAALESFLSTYSVQDILIHITTGIGSISGYALGMTSRVVNLFLSIIISIYTLLYKDLLIATIDRIAKLFIKKRSLEIIKSYLYQTNEIFYKFISTQFLDACILGVLATIILASIGVKYAVTLGILLGICNMIPYFGSMFASIVTVIITFLTGGATLAIITGISLLILQQIDGNIIGPRLMGGALNMNPILIILSITIGGAYFGVIGMFLSIPIAAMLKIIFNNFIELREKKIFTNEGNKYK